MLLYDFHAIGNKLLTFRKRAGLTQAEIAENAGLSDRTYADIERGTVNMRVETLLHICDALHITPDEVLTKEAPLLSIQKDEILGKLDACAPKEKETALRLLLTYLTSVK